MPISVIPSCKETDERLGQERNAWLLIVLTVDGITMLVREVHLSNILVPRSVMLPKSTLESIVHSLNIDKPILDVPPSNFTERRLAQALNVLLATDVIVAGITSSSIPVFWKALSLIDVAQPKSIVLSFVQFEKTLLGIELLIAPSVVNQKSS